MKSSISNMRKNYIADVLLEKNAEKYPFLQFSKWFNDAVTRHNGEANAMILATADDEGKPTARIVLLKNYSEKGFVFYTNSLSKKGTQMSFNPNVALLFFWHDLERQVRIEGQAGMLSETESDEYFNTRPEENKISALISPQSEVIPNREFLEAKYEQAKASYKNKQITRPLFWSGYIVVPEYFEFWQGREKRLHDRLIYTYDLTNSAWIVQRLAP